MRITFLGTGTSFGVPSIGCGCSVCSSPDPRDKRLRSSILIEIGGLNIVVDAGPEFRLQCLRAGLRSLDMLLMTHAHADHVAGLDDIRPLTRERVLPVYGSELTLAEVRDRFAYAFSPLQAGGGLPRFELRPAPAEGIAIAPTGDVAAMGGAAATRIVPVPLMHGLLPILGWRIGKFAYITDCSEIPAASRPILEGIEVLVIDGLRLRPHPTHFNVDQALEAATSLGARETWLTHLNHETSHADLEAYCAERGARVGLRPAWDGLVIEV